MTAPAIRVGGLSKRYEITVAKPADRGRTKTRKLRDLFRRRVKEELWAVRDMSFEIGLGEAVGIVGRNGAGKSTLLKLLARITPPTTGRIEIRGRLASLLEVGTGFNPELTGRENVYLNGAVLGMNRREINRKFDEIVAFSEVERFLHTPVKFYSSGMQIRLAFAVAAHLDPQILVLDEVLAVGDAAFQRKCLEKIGMAAREGRAILFVSHNMPSVLTLCSRALLVKHGSIIMDGTPEAVVSSYLAVQGSAAGDGYLADSPARTGSGEVRVRYVQIADRGGMVQPQLRFAQPFRVVADMEVVRAIPDAVIEFGISTTDGVRVATVSSTDAGAAPFAFAPGWQRVSCDVDLALVPREYVLDVYVGHATGQDVDLVDRAHQFTALSVGNELGYHYPWAHSRGYVRMRGEWKADESPVPSREESAHI